MSASMDAPRDPEKGRVRRWLTEPFASRPGSVGLNIDLDAPALFTAYPRVPDFDLERADMRNRIRRLYEAGAIDEGTPHVVEDRVRHTADIWRHQIELEQLERRRAAAYRIALLTAKAKSRAGVIADIQAELDALEEIQQRPGRQQAQSKREDHSPEEGL